MWIDEMNDLFNKLFLLLLVLIFETTTTFAQKDEVTQGKQISNTLFKENRFPGEYIPKDMPNSSFFHLVSRDENQPIKVVSGGIWQDSVLIASYDITNGNWQGKIVKKFSFYLPDGVAVGKAVIIGIAKDACSLTTYIDNLVYSIEVNTIKDVSRVQVLAEYLVAHGYI